MTPEQAEKAVDKIISDLSGRCGIGDEWDMIDESIQEEIKSDMVSILLEITG